MTAIFARNFDREAAPDGVPLAGPDAEAFERRLEAVRAEAYTAGHRDGSAETESRLLGGAEERRAAALVRLSSLLGDLFSTREEHEQALEAQFFDFAIAVGEKVMPELIGARAHHQVMAQMRRGLRMALGSRQIRIQVAETDADLLTPEIERLLADQGLEGRGRVLRSDVLGPGDLRVDWDRGGLDYSFREICEGLLDVLRKARPRGPSHNPTHLIATAGETDR
jgi:flagellar biosynthesis/type III secretory pathway protein FliH